MGGRRRSGALLAALLAAVALVACSPDRPTTVENRLHTGQQLTYSTQSPVQTLEVTMPAQMSDARRAPWLLVVHGGGWFGGSPANSLPAAQFLARHGYVAFTLSYRLLTPGVPFAEQWSDVVGAWRWLRRHAASLGIDPGRGAIWGASAGGHLAALLANREPGVRAVVSMAGVLLPTLVARTQCPQGCTASHPPYVDDLLHADRTFGWLYSVLEQRVVGQPWEPRDRASVAAWEAIDPSYYLSSASPPVFAAQGTADPVVPPSTATTYGQELGAHHVRNEVVVVRGAGHSEQGLIDASGSRAIAFLAAILR